ncbi:hypothetical protein Agsp01_35840 [Agromyces sp. NBRC 114283]|nr:hypothetical protein Agsp01_35840 [Agromyces sp. NBRC 114283]
MADRTVHCTIVPIGGGRIEIVRYDRSGKWFYESGATRWRLTLDEAASMADDRPAVIWHEGRPGGLMFDARVRRMRASSSRRSPDDAGREETDRG